MLHLFMRDSGYVNLFYVKKMLKFVMDFFLKVHLKFKAERLTHSML